MSSYALPLMLQLKLHLFSANGPGQGVSPHICPATPGGIPDVSRFSCRTVAPGPASQPTQPPRGLLERRCQSHLRHSRDSFAQRGILEFSQLFKSNPCKFWQMVRLPSMLLPEELRDPAAWDTFLNKLTSSPTQRATQLPAPHTAQPPVPAHSLNQPLALAEVEVGLQQLHTGRSGALYG